METIFTGITDGGLCLETNQMAKLKTAPGGLAILPSQVQYFPDRRYTPNRGVLYGRRWQGARVEHLSINRYCVFCKARGERTKATLVDHIIPHKGNEEIFWNKDDWQSLCDYDHSVIKQSIENQAGDDDELLRELNKQATTTPGIPRK